VFDLLFSLARWQHRKFETKLIRVTRYTTEAVIKVVIITKRLKHSFKSFNKDDISSHQIIYCKRITIPLVKSLFFNNNLLPSDSLIERHFSCVLGDDCLFACGWFQYRNVALIVWLKLPRNVSRVHPSAIPASQSAGNMWITWWRPAGR